jgi:hypothetical protein
MKCMNDYGIPQDVINAYTKGKMSSEDAIRLNLKRTEFPDLSPFAWEVIGRIETANPGARALFERYSMYGTNAGEGSLSSDETNRFFTLLREFDEFLGDYLVEKRLSALEPKVRASEACKAISTAVTNIQSKEAEIEKNTRELRLVFSPNYRMFDAMFPHYAGECLSVQSLAKKHVVTATLFQNGEIAGGVLMLMKRVNGRKSLVVIGIDPSVKVVSGIGKEAAMDICDWMMKEVHDYGKANGYGLYITRNIGGITNRYELRRSMGRYFGWGVFPLGFAVDHYFSGTVRNFHLPRKLKKPSAEEMSRRTMVKELYRIEKKVFADNPSIILGKGEFKEMFTDSTAYAVLKKEGKYAGFAVANSVIEKSLLGDDTDEVLAQLRTTLGKVDLAKFEKSLEQDKVYYLDDIAILDRSMGTRKMMREFFQSLESQGADTLLFHARMKEGRIGDFERVMELGGFRKIDEHVEKGWFGGEDFMFMAYFKDQKPSQTSG